jgi:hypothetical protein
LQKVHSTRKFLQNISRFLFENYLYHPCFYPKEPGGTRRFSSSTMNCLGACRYGAYGVLYRVDFYLGAYPGAMVKIEGHRPRWHGLQAVKTDIVWILGKLDSVIDLELFNYIRLGLELYLSLLSIYKERLGEPLVHTIIQSI